jgi:hypothetical protein
MKIGNGRRLFHTSLSFIWAASSSDGLEHDGHAFWAKLNDYYTFSLKCQRSHLRTEFGLVQLSATPTCSKGDGAPSCSSSD